MAESIKVSLPEVHPKIQREFLASRIGIKRILNRAGLPDWIPRRSKSPLRIENLNLSLSHSKNLSIVVGSKSHLLGIDLQAVIDVERSSRLKNRILSHKDDVTSNLLSDDVLTTLIFSAKEAFYKFLHSYLNFTKPEDRHSFLSSLTFRNCLVSDLKLDHVNYQNFSGDLTIELISGPMSKLKFQGSFLIDSGFVIVLISERQNI